MAKPSVYPRWGASGALTTPSGGKQSLGFVPGERGAAQYFNYQLNLIDQWIEWFDGGTKTINFPVVAPAVSAGTLAAPIALLSGSNNQIVIPLELPVGATILAVRARISDSVTGPTELNATLNRGSDGGSLSTLGTSNTSAGSGFAQTLTISAISSPVIASTFYYWVRIAFTTGSTGSNIYNLEVDILQP